MRHVLWLAATTAVGLGSRAAAADPPAAPPRAGELRAAVEPAGRYKVGEAFDQEVVLTRRSAVGVAGATVGQSSQYTFTSTVTVTAVNADGSLTAEQVIKAAKLLNADADLAQPLAAALAKAAGTKFEIAVGPAGAVTKVTAPKDPIRVLEGGNPVAGQSLRLWSLVDADGWKELAGLTFFQPDQPAGGEPWAKTVAHDWGPLGRWTGTAVYAPAKRPKKATADRYDYRYDLSYRPPAAGAKGDLPVTIAAADFRTGAAGGAIAYDPATRRVTAAEETFPVRGAVTAAVAGAEVAVELEEAQNFRLTIGKPATQALVGKRAPAKPGPPK